MTAPADLWAVVCADGSLHDAGDDYPYHWRPELAESPDDLISEIEPDAARKADREAERAGGDLRTSEDYRPCGGGPHRVVRYVAAPEPEANGGTTEHAAREKWAERRARERDL